MTEEIKSFIVLNIKMSEMWIYDYSNKPFKYFHEIIKFINNRLIDYVKMLIIRHLFIK